MHLTNLPEQAKCGYICRPIHWCFVFKVAWKLRAAHLIEQPTSGLCVALSVDLKRFNNNLIAFQPWILGLIFKSLHSHSVCGEPGYKQRMMKKLLLLLRSPSSVPHGRHLNCVWVTERVLSHQASSLQQYRSRVGSSANQSPTSPVSNQGFSPGGSPQVRAWEPVGCLNVTVPPHCTSVVQRCQVGSPWLLPAHAQATPHGCFWCVDS